MGVYVAPPAPFLVLAGTIMLAVHLFIATLIWRGAEEHGMNPPLWTVIYLLTGPVGWIVFMIACQAVGLGASSMAPAGNPARERLVDQRRMGSQEGEGGSRSIKPPKGFSDSHLEDLTASGDWSGALRHAEEMRKLAMEDGNRTLAEDYSRVIIWIESQLKK